MTRFYFPHKKKDGIFYRTLPDMTGITEISLKNFPCFQNSKFITEVKFPQLTSIKGGCDLNFTNCSNLKTISFPELSTIENSSLLFSLNNLLSEAIFPKLTEVTKLPSFDNCSSLKTVSFPSLHTIKGRKAGYYSIQYCYSLTNISFPKLQTIDGTQAMSYCFSSCSSLTTISFPSLTTITYTNTFDECFEECSKLTEIHFKASAQSTVQALSGYSKKFGATNATIYFDL